MLGFDGEYASVYPKANFDDFGKSCKKKKTILKHSIEKPSLLNIENMSPTFCPRFSKETDFYFWICPNSLILHILKILVWEKAHSLFKSNFKATHLPRYDIFWKTLFWTLVSSTNLGLNTVPVEAGQYLWRDFTFIY